VAFRPILAIPQLLLVGFAFHVGGQQGALLAAMELLCLFGWFAILFTGRFPASMRGFALFIFHWWQNVGAYMMLQAAPYPPFGAEPYPLDLRVEPAEQYNRWAVGFRILLVIPHIVVLAFLALAQAIVTVIAWFAILFTGRYPEGMFDFSVGVSRWAARVAAYFFLFVDEYPPFTLAARPGETLKGTAQPA
jgi:hypothetical protein